MLRAGSAKETATGILPSLRVDMNTRYAAKQMLRTGNESAGDPFIVPYGANVKSASREHIYRVVPSTVVSRL